MKIYNTENWECIGETNKDIDVCDIILKDGKYYLVHSKGTEYYGELIAEVKPIDYKPDGEETYGKDYITCPVCGYKDKDSWEMSGDSDDCWICPNCDSELQVERNIQVTYSAKIKEANKNIVKL